MDVARVNCAHDESAAWGLMVAVIGSGISADGRPCKVAMDLGGPKLHTGPLQPGPRVVKVKPRRHEQGRVVAAAIESECVTVEVRIEPGQLSKFPTGRASRPRKTRRIPHRRARPRRRRARATGCTCGWSTTRPQNGPQSPKKAGSETATM
jgi:hypothetical protein